MTPWLWLALACLVSVGASLIAIGILSVLKQQAPEYDPTYDAFDQDETPWGGRTT